MNYQQGLNINIQNLLQMKKQLLTILAANVDVVCVDVFDPPVSFRKWSKYDICDEGLSKTVHVQFKLVTFHKHSKSIVNLFCIYLMFIHLSIEMHKEDKVRAHFICIRLDSILESVQFFIFIIFIFFLL